MLWEHMASPTSTTDTSPQASPRHADSSLVPEGPLAMAHDSPAVAAVANPASPTTYAGNDSSTSQGLDVPQLASCNVAPAFSYSRSDMPGGALTRHLNLEELWDQTDNMSIGEFMVWANEGSCAPPPGFQMLVRYAETLALHHELPLSQVEFRLANGQPLTLDSSARVIAHGHHSINVTLSDPDCVIKVSDSRSIKREVRIHATVDPKQCPHVRAAIPNMTGTVHGAGAGLQFIGLQEYLVPLQEDPRTQDAGRLEALFSQVRFWYSCICSYLTVRLRQADAWAVHVSRSSTWLNFCLSGNADVQETL